MRDSLSAAADASKVRVPVFTKSWWYQLPVGEEIWLSSVDLFQPPDRFSFTHSPFLSHLPLYQFPFQPIP
ncbi:hypothetical protein [Algoriphagus alkaliphilus]|uniref:hypothetical protein n=1 Tax=Algoriphagus alkaliphilus TaxID=279824 RepID=UPI001113BFFE|nr:hypothetical protein [Algoriphagus alkaliphilus]